MSEPTAPVPESTHVEAAPAPGDSVKPQENGELKVNGEAGAASEEPVGHKVFVGNLAYATTEETLREFFKEFESDIVAFNVVHRGTRPAGYAFVTFAALPRAQEAVTALTGKELDGRVIIVEIAKAPEEKSEKKPRKKTTRAKAPQRVGEVSEEEAAGEAKDGEARIDVPETVEGVAGGDVTQKKKRTNRKPKPRRKDGEEAAGEEAVAVNGAKLEETKLEGDAATKGAKRAPRVKKPRAPARPRRPAGQDPEGTPSPNMLFVANLPFTVTDAVLAELFTSEGINVVSARIVRRRWAPRRSKGYGFVDVGDEQQQKTGVEKVSGKQIDGREVVVKIAVNSQLNEDDEDNHEGEDKENVEAAAQDNSPEATVLAT